MSYQLHILIQERLWLKILLGMVLGIAVGTILGPVSGIADYNTANAIGEWLALPGYLFLALLQMIVVPLVFASIILGIASSQDMNQLKSVGLKTALYFLATTAMSIVIGISVAEYIKPGRFISGDVVLSAIGTEMVQVNTNISTVSSPSFSDLPVIIGNLIPSNPLGSMVDGQMLQVVLFSIIVGIALISLSHKQAVPILDLLSSLQEVCMVIVRWCMLFAPFAVFGLLTKFTITLGIDTLLGMTIYVGTVLLGLLLLFCIYLIIAFVVMHKGPIAFLKAVKDALLIAFSTSSSAMVMPLSIRSAQLGLGVRPSISQFVIPLGATVNMNGTALYQGVATVFLAQVFGIDLDLSSLVLILVTVVGASIGTPSTPGVGIVILSMVLTGVGIPTEGIALIIGVDRILDMVRTSVNVTGDLVACGVMDRFVDGSIDANLEPNRVGVQ